MRRSGGAEGGTRTLTRRLFSFVTWLILTALLSGCQSAGPNSSPATVPVLIGDRTFTLEIANTDDARQTGLMHRDSMPADYGMIFVFPDERPRSFWMKNTKMPLDILYMNSAGRVVSIKQMKPMDETPVPSDFPAKFAIELNAGTAEQVGAKPGHVINVPPEAQVAEE